MTQDLQRTIQAITGFNEDRAAAFLLTKHKGDPRAAEVDAWAIYDHCAGGAWGLRPKPSEAVIHAKLVIVHIRNNSEDPRVPRTAIKHPSRQHSR